MHPLDVEAIRCEMARIWRRHHDDIADVIAGADTVVGWGRNIRPYSWAILAATALYCMVTHTLRKFAMKSASQVIVTDERMINEPQTTSVTRSATRPTWLGEAASLFTMVAIRAAQNCAACCLDDWIAARRVVGPTRKG